jgi:hypothetical protein
MPPEQAIQHARVDIAELLTVPTHSSCDRLHSAIRGYCQALVDCSVIGADEYQALMAEADEGLRAWEQTANPLSA